MNDQPKHVLFLCTGNSARSILAEVVMNSLGRGQFIAHSAGSHPAGRVNPFAIELLQKNRLPTDGLRSKNWDEFAAPGAPALDFVFTVCDSAANEVCPIWPGQPITAHWGLPDPAAVEGSADDKAAAFAQAHAIVKARLLALLALPAATWSDRGPLKDALDRIGFVQPGDGQA